MSTGQDIQTAPDAKVFTRIGPTKVNLVSLLLAIMVFALALACGYQLLGTGKDFSAYEAFYHRLRGDTHLDRSRFEVGYKYTAWAAKIIFGLTYNQYLTIIAAVSLGIKFRLLRKYAEAPILAAIVYILLIFPLQEYSAVRAGVALAFGYAAIDLWIERRRLLAALSFLIGMSFHTSIVALALAAAFVLAIAKKPWKTATLLIVLALTLLFFTAAIIMPHVAFLNRLVITYLTDPYYIRARDSHSPILIAIQLSPLVAMLLASAAFLRPWARPADKIYFFLSIFAVGIYLALIQIPVLAPRIRDMFMFSFLLYAFRFDAAVNSRIPPLMFLVVAIGAFSRAVQLGYFS